MTMRPRPLQNIDTGRLGFTGFFDRMNSQWSFNAAQFLQIIAWLLWLETVPPKYDYRLSDFLTLMGIVKFVLLIKLLRRGWELLVGGWYGLRWLKLERQGLQWVRMNDHHLRVALYRERDGSLEVDRSTRAERLRSELEVVEARRVDLLTKGWLLILNVAGCLLVRPGFYTLYSVIEYQWPGSTYFRTMSTNLYLPGFVQFLWAVLVLIPMSVEVLAVLSMRQIYRLGANYIPGAHVKDAFVSEKTLETLRAREDHGNAKFVSAEDAIRSMGANE